MLVYVEKLMLGILSELGIVYQLSNWKSQRANEFWVVFYKIMGVF